MRCDYCGGSFEIEKFKYKGKTLKGQHRRKTLKFCLNCLCYGIPMSREKRLASYGMKLKKIVLQALMEMK